MDESGQREINQRVSMIFHVVKTGHMCKCVPQQIEDEHNICLRILREPCCANFLLGGDEEKYFCFPVQMAAASREAELYKN